MKRRIGLGVLCGVVATTALPMPTRAAAQPPAHPPALHLHLCMSFPFGVATQSALVNGIRRGIQMANGQWKSRMAAVGIALDPPVALDNTGPDALAYGPDQERQDAEKCLADKHAIAYIGGLRGGAAVVSEPILNEGGMLMISPADPTPALTDPALRATHEPATFAHRTKYLTFFRTVTSDVFVGPVAATFMSSALHIKSYFLVDDKHSVPGELALSFSRFAQRRLRMRQLAAGQIDPTSAATIAETADAVTQQVASRRPPSLFYGGNPDEGGALLRRLRARGWSAPFVGGDALFTQQFLTANDTAATNLFVAGVGLDSAEAAATFQTAYHRYFPHKTLQPLDASAYDATGIILNAIYQARHGGTLRGSIAAMRRSLLPIVAVMRYPGVTGTVAFDKNGDTVNRVVTVYRVRSSGWQPAGIAHILGTGGPQQVTVSVSTVASVRAR
ncbi:MAG TPA: branched-chain amino acid ABC transporter substrate-binding protein [Chloroflexota bacterium]|nr:branched-chain amino acid ABC transporter substrate-binding protein [Chloroflexota bacterium]